MLVNVKCPECGRVFRWDGRGTYDQCPGFGCLEDVNCLENFDTIDDSRYYWNQRIKAVKNYKELDMEE